MLPLVTPYPTTRTPWLGISGPLLHSVEGLVELEIILSINCNRNRAHRCNRLKETCTGCDIHHRPNSCPTGVFAVAATHRLLYKGSCPLCPARRCGVHIPLLHSSSRHHILHIQNHRHSQQGSLADETRLPVFSACAPSMAPTALKAQQEPHCPGFLHR